MKPLWLLMALLAAAGAGSAAPILPPEFIDESRATGLVQPVNFDFLPDGRVLVVERATARIRLMRAAGEVADTVGTVEDVRTSAIDEGLLGIAVDPRWPDKPYVYVHLTSALSPSIRIVRYALTGDVDATGNGRLALDPASRREILSDLPDDNSLHNGGTIVFGPDDRLYVALGDDGVPCSAQDKHQLRGKLLRFKVNAVEDGGGPAPSYYALDPLDNPFSNDPDPRARLVWQYGLRNPWTFDFDPGTKQCAIADVGEFRYEEIDLAVSGGHNFGWPFFEGNAPYQFTCENPDFSNLTAPSFVYGRDSTNAGLTEILGGICYHPPLLPSGFPQEYWGQVFYLDFYSGHLFRLACDVGGCEPAPPVAGQPDALAWGTGFQFVPRMRFGPDAALWYLQGGELRRIHHPGIIGVPEEEDANALVSLRAFPVPSRGRLTFEARGAGGRIGIYDLAGRRRRALAVAASESLVSWDGRGEDGAALPGGVYFARLETPAGTATRRVVLVSGR